MRPDRRWLAVLVLFAWVLLGPIGTAFDACGAMMALCEIPCGAPSALLDATPVIVPLAVVATVPAAGADHPPPVLRAGLDPPPKPLRLSA
jgi:hypothetical protein